MYLAESSKDKDKPYQLPRFVSGTTYHVADSTRSKLIRAVGDESPGRSKGQNATGRTRLVIVS